MLQGQCAIVTGSTSGIGLGITRGLGASGAHSGGVRVVLCSDAAAQIHGAAVPFDGAWSCAMAPSFT
jgi:NAD(P)-dependent dehydrogenase (short-subunit alcohol dehydrogenase family)